MPLAKRYWSKGLAFRRELNFKASWLFAFNSVVYSGLNGLLRGPGFGPGTVTEARHSPQGPFVEYLKGYTSPCSM